jgi:carboxymethylenebutenolidase
MTETPVNITTADGIADGVLFVPGSGTFPGVLHLTDIGGIRPETLGMARRQAEQGYTVLVPNVFYRTGRPPLFDFPRTPGDEKTMARFRELAAPMTPDAMERDAAAYVDFLAAQPSVSAGRIGVVGYCFTGAMALRTAAVRPDRIAVMASFHGGSLYTETPQSPHLVLPRVKARLYFGHATNDRTMTEDAIAKLDTALKSWGGRFESEIYAGPHAWTVPGTPAYTEGEAERAFATLTDLLKATLRD